MKKAGIIISMLLGGALLMCILISATKPKNELSNYTVAKTCSGFTDAEYFINSYKNNGYTVKFMIGDRNGCLVVMEKI